ncbi:MAG: NUDIX hydrolase [Schaedlerella sp.]|nr:NUDIX hydrolase [Schaedlerella sp.]
MKIIESIENFVPWNEQEEADKSEFLYRLRNGENLLTRDNKSAHITVSGWVVNPARTKILMVYHNLYDSWSWLGGHADGESDLLKVAKKEVQEESGLKAVNAVKDEIFSLEILPVSGHMKKGKYISSHLHMNVTYLLEADDTLPLRIKPDENSDAAWFGLDEAIKKSNEQWFKERIYSKLNEKLGMAGVINL